MRVVSAVQPSGPLHLGNYFGALLQQIDLQHQFDSVYFIANYHAMTTIKDPSLLRQYTFDVAVDYLTLGLNPQKALFFRQSDISEVQELAWILSVVTGKGLLERAHSYKDKVNKGIVPSLGLFCYPVLMAADILLYQGTLIPTGQDQQQHIEMTQDMAQSFNYIYKADFFKRPEVRLTAQSRVLGTDGDKMSRSYGNTIGIFEDSKSVQKKIMSLKTDSLPLESPKNPDTCLVFSFIKLFASAEEIKHWESLYRNGGLGYGVVKKRLFELYEERFSPLRLKRQEFLKNPQEIENILKEGAVRARKIAQETMREVRKLTGL